VLGWPDFDEDKQMQRSICLDFLYDTLTFSKERGFCWEKAACVLNFADRFVHRFAGLLVF